MSTFFDPEYLSRLDYDRLPGLVQKGQDREQILNRIVEAWCQPHGVTHDPKSPIKDAVDRHIAEGGRVLDGVALWDEAAPGETDGRPGAPIDLGDLLRMVEKRLREQGAPEPFEQRADLFLLLRGCRVYRCNAQGLSIRPRFVSYAVRFDSASFRGAKFGDSAIFAAATFGDSASFREATFGARGKFRFADLRRANLNDADLSRCDLRFVRGLVLDVTRVRDAHFSPRSPDPWSILRRA